ncbi:MAG: hypothetical protein ACXWQO_15435 [Bdellovibrionota bacterium]
MHKYFLSGLSLVLLLPLSAFAQKAKVNAATAAEIKALVAHCVDGKMDNPEFDQAKVLESYVNNLCLAFKASPTPSPKNIKHFMNSAADFSELQVMRGECVMNVVEGKVVDAPRTTKGVDMHAALSQLSDVAGAKMNGNDSPCKPQMCETGAEALKIRLACKNFADWDSYRRMADTMSGAEYSGENKDPAQEIALRGFKGILEQAAVNLMMARGHMKLPPMPGAAPQAEEEDSTNGTKKAD